MIFLKEFWNRIVGDGLAGSTAPLRSRRRVLEIGVFACEREWLIRETARRLCFRMVDPWPAT